MHEVPIPAEGFSIAHLKGRVLLGSSLIKMLQQDSDPQAQEAIENLQDQQRRVNELLVVKIAETREEQGEPVPPPVIVNCKPVVMTAKAKR